MSVKLKYGFRKWLVNAFGALGYVGVLLGWMWTIVLYLNFLKSFFVSIAPEIEDKIDQAPIVVPTDGSLVTSEGSLIGVVFAVIITAAVIVLTLYVLIKAPSVAIKTTRKIVHDTAEYVAPVVLKTQHIAPTPPAVKTTTRHIMVVLKIIAIVVPILLGFVSRFLQQQVVDSTVALYGSVAIGLLACILFGLQYLLAKVLSVRRSDIR